MNDTIRSILIGLVAGIVLALAFVSGFFVRQVIGLEAPVRAASNGEQAQAEGYPLVDEVQGFLDSVYLREQPTYEARQYAAIRGLLGSLEDPNTFFIDPPVARSEADALAGTYGGIGVQVRRNETGEFVLFPFPDSPAAEAGITDGALLLAINSVALEFATPIDSVDQLLRGEVKDGNGVELTIQQADNELTTFVEFQVINIPSVVWRVLEEDERFGYVQIIRFTSRTPDELREALQQLDSTQALIVDLRNNSGGLLRESIDVASEFLDGGVITYEITKDEEKTLDAQRGGMATDMPVVVLVNRGTASASELVAGAIRDRERGILIGQQTFGKGTVQQIFALSDGSSIHITSAEWFTPNRTPLSGVGLTPNIEMIPDINGRDVELGEAIRYLRQQLNNQQ